MLRLDLDLITLLDGDYMRAEMTELTNRRNRLLRGWHVDVDNPLTLFPALELLEHCLITGLCP